MLSEKLLPTNMDAITHHHDSIQNSSYNDHNRTQKQRAKSIAASNDHRATNSK
jgi:hypothetical protein